MDIIKPLFLIDRKFFKNIVVALLKLAKNIGWNLQVISLEFAKELKENEFLVIPRCKVCGNCKLWLNKLCKEALGMVYDAALTGDSTDSKENTCVTSLSNSQLNTSLSGIGQSPIKLHSMTSCSQSHYEKWKLSLINNELIIRVAIVLSFLTWSDKQKYINWIWKQEKSWRFWYFSGKNKKK